VVKVELKFSNKELCKPIMPALGKEVMYVDEVSSRIVWHMNETVVVNKSNVNLRD